MAHRPRTIAIAAVTLDGKIARNSHELVRWTSKEDKDFFRSETARIGVMILGNTTFETFPSPLPNRRHIVMTRNADAKKSTSDLVSFTQESPADILNKLADEGVKEVVIAGGSRVYSRFIKERLLDEFWLTFEPIGFGEGISVVQDTGEFHAELIDVKKLNANSLLARYRILYT